MPRYDYKPFAYSPPPELAGAKGRRWPVAIIGAGPVGLTLAVDLALKGVACVVLDDNNVVSVGSRAICWAKRTLEIFDRLGVGERMLEMGVTWNAGRLYHRDREVYSFDLQPEAGGKFPAFINLQQYHVEQYLVERCADFPGLIGLRFKNKATGHADCGGHVRIDIETPDGNYALDAQYLIACDGAKSPARARMNLAFAGHTFEEQFLIVDVEMPQSPFGTGVAERWFWFEPEFHQGQSALLHKQPGDIYRIDLQLGADADADSEKQPEKIIPRIRRMVGGKPFEIDWMSIYKFTCARLERFVHNRVIFAGDAAHIVSPFGARGGNGGIQDADNLAWKLAAVLDGRAPPALLQTYDSERIHGADENILHSSRATRFMTPKSAAEAIFREAVLDLAADMPFARKLINSGRLSVPCSLAGFELQTPSQPGLPEPGSPAADAPLGNGIGDTWLLQQLKGEFTLVGFGEGPDTVLNDIAQINVCAADAKPGVREFSDKSGLAFGRYGAGLSYLFRPDQHVAAVFSQPTAGLVKAARDRALGFEIREPAA